MVLQRPICILFFFGVTLATTTAYVAPSLGREEIAGIWRLTVTQSFLPTMDPASNNNDHDDGQQEWRVLLKLKEDGSFAQYGGTTIKRKEEGLHEWLDKVLARGSDGTVVTENGNDADFCGTWDYRDHRLLLAKDRPPDADALLVHDTIFAGNVVARAVSSLSEEQTKKKNKEVEEATRQDYSLSVPEGEVSVGKFMYPRHHPSFFEQPMVRPTPTGRFMLRQILGTLNTRRNHDSSRNKKKIARYQKRDFHGRKFLLTVSPLKPRRGKPKMVWSRVAGGYVKESSVGRKQEQDPDDQPFDVRVMPIEFLKNNTFVAVGINKILRGRYGTIGEEKEKLWFVVSLFGAGRSMKGSVYSEGQGLSHDDRRSYVGAIEEMNVNGRKQFHVEGSVIYGTDFVTRTAAAVGKFVMIEMSDSSSPRDEGGNQIDGKESMSGDSFQ